MFQSRSTNENLLLARPSLVIDLIVEREHVALHARRHREDESFVFTSGRSSSEASCHYHKVDLRLAQFGGRYKGNLSTLRRSGYREIFGWNAPLHQCANLACDLPRIFKYLSTTGPNLADDNESPETERLKDNIVVIASVGRAHRVAPLQLGNKTRLALQLG